MAMRATVLRDAPGLKTEDFSTLSADSHLGSYWSTTNVGEAMPGVPTPLCWSIWGPAAELATRGAFVALGALDPPDGQVPADERDRAVSIFCGRVAARVDFLAGMGDRLPGTSGEALVEQFLGVVPQGMRFEPTRRRYPVIAVKLPAGALTVRRRLLAQHRSVAEWWPRELARTGGLDLAGARGQFRLASRRFIHCVGLQSNGMFIAVQPTYDRLLGLIDRAGAPHLAGALMGAGGDHAETEVVLDLWRFARGKATLGEFLASHGYHGPLEGELSGRVWRENPEPVLRLAERYRDRDQSEDPQVQAEQRAEERRRAERALLAGLPQLRRPAARAVLLLARRNSSLRGIGKSTFLRAFDVSRASARRCGELLAEDGVLDDPEDVFYLTASELEGELPGDARELVDRRRAERAAFEGHEMPPTWRGVPSPTPEAAVDLSKVQRFQGIAASRGSVVGPARVVTDPEFGDVEPDEILVAPTTDPSWAAIMFLSKALVVDIGGHLSHAAIVARELGIPCVVDTRTGSKGIRTGDRIRVDGDRGVVEVIERGGSR